MEQIWLTSYPRSGNTLIRVILKDCFQIICGSKYDESRADDTFRKLMGVHEGPTPPRLIKTHEGPENSSPAIYLVRDGIAAVVSFFHFLLTYEKPATLEDVICGRSGFGSWSDHVRAWQPLQRQNTLLLRFEEFTADPEVAVEALATFINARPTGKFSRKFDELRSLNSAFFRAGSNEQNRSELTVPQQQLFEQLHGPTMSELGYQLR